MAVCKACSTQSGTKAERNVFFFFFSRRSLLCALGRLTFTLQNDGCVECDTRRLFCALICSRLCDSEEVNHDPICNKREDDSI